MNSPPAQTPVTFLKGGAAAMFDADCVKALNDQGYNQNDFGSYDHVNKRIAAAKGRCAEWDTASDAERRAAGMRAPTREDRYLAGPRDDSNPKNPYPDACQSGHLTQNGVYQGAGGRGDPCSNLDTAPGHDDNQFPCMPQAGHAHQDGGEHCQATAHEKASAAACGPPGSVYPADQIDADSRDRVCGIADNRQLGAANRRRVLSGGLRGRADREAAASGAEAKQAAMADAEANPDRAASRANAPYNQPITGKTAGECIDNFRKAAEAAMQDRCKDATAKNRLAANGRAQNPGESDADYAAAGEAHRAELAQAAADAKAEAKSNPTDENKAAATAAKTESTKAASADCRATQGAQLASGDTGPRDGRVPSNSRGAH